MIRFFVVCWALLFAAPLAAACNGTDLRGSLSADENAELQNILTNAPFAEGNHWRAERGGNVVHLIGTMHLSDPRLDGPAERLGDIVAKADLLLLELTSEDEAALQSKLASDPSFLLMPDSTLPELLNEEQWQQMSNALSARGLPPFVASRFQPWYVSLLLAIPACSSLEELSGNGLDARLEAIATDNDVPRAALENVEAIFEAFASQPLDVQTDMMLSALVDPQISEDLFETLLGGYFEERTLETWAVSAVLAERFSPIDVDRTADIFELIKQKLLIDRNRAWIPVIEAASAQHDIVVAAFGAAHLPGENGVLALLQARGFELERLPF